MFDGQYSNAISTAKRLREQVTDADIRTLGRYFEAYTAVYFHVLIRFGKWDEILAEPLPEDLELYPTFYSTGLYARSLALAALRQVGM